jgi:succinyl-diaminopimelate desuccinylase
VNKLENKDLFLQIETLKTEMINALMQLIRIPAVGPENGGDGEIKKANALVQILTDAGFSRIEHFDSEDQNVASGRRPNIIAFLEGKEQGQKLWIVTHLDVVPPGEESLWKVTKPSEPLLKDDCIYGRGSEDNGQSLIASIFAAKAIKQLGVVPKRTIALAFVSDEEQGSTKGIQHLISKGIFQEDDLVLVPDSGNPKGDFIEIAEKSILWFKLITIGKQTHASLPNKGLNAYRIAMQLTLALDAKLHQKYNVRNDSFTVPTSTFEPTKKEKNVDAVNIVPGEDVTYFDCRILPQYNLDEVLHDINELVATFEQKTEAKIKIEVLQKQVAPIVEETESKIAGLLKSAIKQARGVSATLGGIGGGTCAAFFRKEGIPAVVWSTIDEVAHQPDEYAKVRNMVEDAKIFALLALM